MTKHPFKAGMTAVLATALAGSALAFAPAAQADDKPSKSGNRSLAKVLMADRGYDHNWHDFDILEKAVTTVLSAKPDSPVAVLTKGKTRVTAFLPTDAAFRTLVSDLTGKKKKTERGTFKAIAKTVDVDTLETVLLYHVVAGKTLGAKKVAKLDEATVTTAAGIPLTIRIGKKVRLVDQDHNSRNARVVDVNINKGNKQIAHAIDRVLRPIDL